MVKRHLTELLETYWKLINEGEFEPDINDFINMISLKNAVEYMETHLAEDERDETESDAQRR